MSNQTSAKIPKKKLYLLGMANDIEEGTVSFEGINPSDFVARVNSVK